MSRFHRRFTWFFALIIVFASLLPVAAQNETPQFNAALARLSQKVGQQLSILNVTWSFTLYNATNTALDCSFVTNATALVSPIQAHNINITYNGVVYNFRVSQDSATVIDCNAPQTAPVGPTHTPVPAAPAATAVPSNCPADFAGYLAPRLRIGGSASLDPTARSVALRNSPARTGAELTQIIGGSVLPVVAGPVCEVGQGIVWWQVTYNGFTGWTAESTLAGYLYEPSEISAPDMSGFSTNGLTGDRRMLSVSNIANVVTLSTVNPGEPVRRIGFSPNTSHVALTQSTGVAVANLPSLIFNNILSTSGREQASNPVFSADSRYMAYNSYNGTGQIDLIDLQTGTRAAIPNPSNDQINTLAFSPVGTRLAVGSGGFFEPRETSIRLYDIATLALLQSIPTQFAVFDIAFSADGNQMAWIDNAVHVYDLVNNREIITEPAVVSAFGAVAYRPRDTFGTSLLPDQQALAFTDGNMVRLLGLGRNDEVLFTVPNQPDIFPVALSFSPDGSLLAMVSGIAEGGVGQRGVYVFDVANGTVLFSMQGAYDAMFNPDGTLLVVSTDVGTVFLGVQ